MTCLCCHERPVKFKGRKVCQACYSKLRRENRLNEYPDWPEPVIISVKPDWLKDAVCRGIDPAMFFDESMQDEAKAVCAGCPVVAQCRDLADACESGLSKSHVSGVFGGETAAERITRRKGKRERLVRESDPIETTFPVSEYL